MQTEEVKRIYNNNVKGKYNYEYEQKRWLQDDIKKAGYEMTLSAINRYGLPVKFSACLELGPGHGTWTKLLLKAHPGAKFDLVDISEEMLKLARKRFGNNQNVRYFEEDFLSFSPDKQYDFFFSARAIEYIPNKELAVEKITDLLYGGGRGFIITKTPKYLRNRMLGREVPKFHSGQAAPKKLTKLLEKYGARDIAVYPVTMSFPIIKSAFANKLLHKIFYKHKLNFISQQFCESYCVKFKK